MKIVRDDRMCCLWSPRVSKEVIENIQTGRKT